MINTIAANPISTLLNVVTLSFYANQACPAFNRLDVEIFANLMLLRRGPLDPNRFLFEYF